MLVVHLIRKPLSEGNVAANILRWGCGALNIDACRISTQDNLGGGAYAKNASDRHDGAENWRYKRGDKGGLQGKEFQPPPGRWPANLILSHYAGCMYRGMETIPQWDCEPECPVVNLDDQTGERLGMPIGTGPRKYGGGGGFGDRLNRQTHPGFGDTGGASRFFKQVQE